ncbi:MAG: hypothetical protein IPG10_04625 [Flavobacteriales bacterium]|jgi:hypothetical protein|nr:hypothetical protein [Flavobacteriales bacterium]MBK6754550.1 hypothetical protein [Flavobacteriales bacterium]MBK7268702.1 hypothetical protein [Flavobacteriales bacterium]MBK7752911.1 hypothetical protein [Flavobacteriales bacterium]MBK9076229.1 hypothetical protein [Flavobacteriales bacterium]
MSKPLLSLFVFALLLAPAAARAQDYRDSTATEKEKIPDAPRPWKDRIWFGGGLGLSFGSVTNIAIEPMVGYKITKNGKLSAGVGISYQYFRDNRGTYGYETSIYGGRLFTRYRIIEQLFAHVEYNQLSFELPDYYQARLYRRWVPFLLVGGGYSARLGGNTYLTAMVLFDVIQDAYSPYSSGEPWISAGVGFGF